MKKFNVYMPTERGGYKWVGEVEAETEQIAFDIVNYDPYNGRPWTLQVQEV
ncbi:hypothetical protein AGMMS49975_16560 [Clostridia bacterium]|nr:hypothetical protein AGMMS49975_16560 [Clostridia bacterium]